MSAEGSTGTPPGNATAGAGARRRSLIAALLLLAAALVAAGAAIVLLQQPGTPTGAQGTPGASTPAGTQAAPSLGPTSKEPTPLPSAPATPAPTPAPTPTQNTSPTILSFKAPATADCTGGAATATVHLSWKLANATGVIVGIGSPDEFAAYSGTSGAADLPFSCQNAQNTYYLTTTGGGGAAAVEKRTVQRSM